MGDVVSVIAGSRGYCEKSRTLFKTANLLLERANYERPTNPKSAARKYLSAAHGFYLYNFITSASDEEITSKAKELFFVAREMFFSFLTSETFTLPGHLWLAAIDSSIDPYRAVHNIREDISEIRRLLDNCSNPVTYGLMSAVYLLKKCEKERPRNAYLAAVLCDICSDFHPSIEVKETAKIAAAELYVGQIIKNQNPYLLQGAASFNAAAGFCQTKRKKLALYLRAFSYALASNPESEILRGEIYSGILSTLKTDRVSMETALFILSDCAFLPTAADLRIKAHLLAFAALQEQYQIDQKRQLLMRALNIFNEHSDHIQVAKVYEYLIDIAPTGSDRNYCFGKAVEALKKSSELFAHTELVRLRSKMEK